AGAADRAASAVAGGVPQRLHLLALRHGVGQGAALVVGRHVRERDHAVADAPLAFVREREGVAREFLFGGVARAWFDAARAADAQHGAVVVDGADRVLGRAFVVDLGRVVEALARAVHVQVDGLLVGQRPGQARAQRLVLVVDRLAAAAEAQRARVHV